MMRTEVEILVGVGGFSVHLYLNSSTPSSGERFQKRKTVVLFAFNSELNVRVDRVKGGVKFLYMSFL